MVLTRTGRSVLVVSGDMPTRKPPLNLERSPGYVLVCDDTLLACTRGRASTVGTLLRTQCLQVLQDTFGLTSGH